MSLVVILTVLHKRIRLLIRMQYLPCKGFNYVNMVISQELIFKNYCLTITCGDKSVSITNEIQGFK